jgi:hypothetical protein
MPEPPESDELAEACPGPDVVIKCTGVAGVVLDLTSVGAAGVVCLTGVSSGGHLVEVDEGQQCGRGRIGQRQPAPL